jgi:hypothetical protein
MRIAVLPIEGVLSETDNLLNSPPTPMGRQLFKALKTEYRVILTSIQPDFDVARMWLKKEHFTQWSMILCYTPGIFSQSMWKVQMVRDMLAEGWDVGMVYDADQRVTEELQALGVITMLVSYPTIRPGRIPEDPGPLRPWGDIEARVESSNLLEQGG